MRNDQQQDVLLGKIEERVFNLANEVEKIMSNHLPHIQARLDSVEKKLAYYAGGIVVATAIVQFLLNK